MIGRAIAAVTIAAALTACSGAAKHAAFHTTYGQDAAMLLSHVPGCTGITAEAVGDYVSAASSAATCVLSGHKVVLYAWPSADAQQTPLSMLSGAQTHAAGTGWTELVVDGSALTAQQSIAHTFASSFVGGTVVTS